MCHVFLTRTKLFTSSKTEQGILLMEKISLIIFFPVDTPFLTHSLWSFCWSNQYLGLLSLCNSKEVVDVSSNLSLILSSCVHSL